MSLSLSLFLFLERVQGGRREGASARGVGAETFDVRFTVLLHFAIAKDRAVYR